MLHFNYRYENTTVVGIGLFLFFFSILLVLYNNYSRRNTVNCVSVTNNYCIMEKARRMLFSVQPYRYSISLLLLTSMKLSNTNVPVNYAIKWNFFQPKYRRKQFICLSQLRTFWNRLHSMCIETSLHWRLFVLTMERSLLHFIIPAPGSD